MSAPSQALFDQAARDHAIDPRLSCIVQAPAGSGKTELLSDRILQLLAIAPQPEAIVAITFTKKAAAEMRLRVLDRLQMAEDIRSGRQPPPTQEKKIRTWQLAERALARDTAQDWRLLQQPDRLRILTFDALCGSLARQLPVLSKLGTGIGIEEDATALYELAAQRTLELLEDTDYGSAIRALLHHLDNDGSKARTLLANMLARRDQWQTRLADLHDCDLAERLQADARAVCNDVLQHAQQLLNPFLHAGFFAAARFAGTTLAAEHSSASLTRMQDWHRPLPADADALADWQALADLLLTGSGEWRKQINKNQGFPAGKTEPAAQHKKTVSDLLEQLHLQNISAEALSVLRLLPDAGALENSAGFLRVLASVLSHALAQLWLVFSETGRVDFTAISEAAQRALGSEEEPTDLGLLLDCSIQHLLVDECQDNSPTQMELLKRLTAGWQQGDGRTLFMVGDPMQSIYRFRKAEVGLFLQARQHGLPQVPLQALSLQTNFRSQAKLVEWLNQIGPHLLGGTEDAVQGAVPYSPAVAFHTADAGDAVLTWAFAWRSDRKNNADKLRAQCAEAEAIADWIVSHQDAHDSIAILGRTRAQLAPIARALRARELAIEAIDTEPLAGHPAIGDLLQLTRALLHPADRLAWLCVLRAPWAGLSLADLHALFARIQNDEENDTPQRSVPDDLQALFSDHGTQTMAQTMARLSADGQQRVQRVVPVLLAACAARGRLPLHRLVKHCWLQVGGPALLPNADAEHAVAQFFEMLESLPVDSEDPLEALKTALGKLYARAAGGAKIKLMTLHKSKGLEFDCVILPQLSAQPRHDETPLLRWSSISTAQGDALLMAGWPGPRSTDADRTDAFLKFLEKQRAQNETRRLLYVALTRAKKQLLLSTLLDVSKDDWQPPAASLLAGLWPQWAQVFRAQLREDAQQTDHDTTEVLIAASKPVVRPLQRLPADFRLPETAHAPTSVLAHDALQEASLPDLLHAGDTARAIGTLTHRWLESFATDPARWLADSVVLRDLSPLMEKQLRHLQVAEPDLARAASEVLRALDHARQDARARAVLIGHQHNACEWPLLETVDGRVQTHIIDRSYVDADGVRWIVDYKIAGEDAADPALLAARVDAYRPQLERYGRVLHKLENRPIRLALYFPLQQAFFDWPYVPETA